MIQIKRFLWVYLFSASSSETKEKKQKNGGENVQKSIFTRKKKNVESSGGARD